MIVKTKIEKNIIKKMKKPEEVGVTQKETTEDLGKLVQKLFEL